MQTTRKILAVSLVLLLAGAALAYAQGGRWGGGGGGGGRMMYDCPWYEEGRMGRGMMRGGPGWGAGPGVNLTEEQREQWQAERNRFFTETEQLRTQIRDRRIALSDELNKPTPDANAAARIQNEISQLQNEFDQKALQHKLEVRRILPDDAKPGFGAGRGPRR